LLLFSPTSFVLPSQTKNLKIKIYRTVIFPVVLCGFKTWSLTLREEHRVWVFENRVLRRISGRKREGDGSWRKLHDELHSLYSSPNIVTVMGGTCGTHAGEVFSGFWLVGPKVRDHWEDLGVGGRITIRWTLGRQGSMGRTGFSWLRIGSDGGLL
jgi:hypothetical protein